MPKIRTLIEVHLANDHTPEGQTESFLKIRETLTRMGIASHKTKTLYQSCHILQKRGRYYIVHFLEMFALDGKVTSITDDDYARRNTIIALLEQWGLLSVDQPELISTPKVPIDQIKILPYREKQEWNLVAKYTIGNPSKN